MSRLQNYLNEQDILSGYIYFLSMDDTLNEMSDEHFNAIKRLGNKMGLKVSKSHSLFSLLKKFGKDVTNVISLTARYHFARLTRNKKKEQELKSKLDRALTKTTRRDVAAFFLQLDKSSLSLTSIPRHILQSVFGLEISVYSQWKESKDYILTSLSKVEDVLGDIVDDDAPEMETLRKLIMSIEELEA